MSVKEIIKKRVSNAKFIEREVQPSLVIDLLETAVYAPNHKMREPWRFVILDAQGKHDFQTDFLSHVTHDEKEHISAMLKKVFAAPLITIMIMKKEDQLRDEREDLQASGAMIQNFLLLLTEHGLSSFWKTPNYIESDGFRSTLGLSQDELVIGMIMIGYSESILEPKPRLSAASKTTIYRSKNKE